LLLSWEDVQGWVFLPAELAQDAVRELSENIALQGKQGESEITGYRHLEDFVSLENRKYINPSRPRPVVPEFPEESANESSQKKAE
jgi:hypothetical protein